MSRSSGFGSTSWYYRPIKTRFPYASPIRLSSQHNVSRWPIIQKVRSHPSFNNSLYFAFRRWKAPHVLLVHYVAFRLELLVYIVIKLHLLLQKLLKLGLPLFVRMQFQDLFHSPPGVLFAFPSRYWFTIGRLGVFSLGGWSPHLQTGFHVSRPTSYYPSSLYWNLCTGLSPTTVHLPRWFHSLNIITVNGLSDFARHYSRNLGWFLFL